MKYDCDKLATGIRAFLAVKLISQTEVAKGTDIPVEMLSRFLRRRVNLVDADLDKIITFLDMDNFLTKLSAPANVEGISHERQNP